MAISPFALTTLEAVRRGIKGLDSDVEKEDLLLTGLINSVSATFERVTKRKLKARTYKPTGAVESSVEENLLLHGHERAAPDRFMLPQWPVNSVTAITIKQADLLVTNQTVLVSGEDWLVINDTGVIHLIDGDTFAEGWNNLEITWNGGIPTTSMDYATLQEACNDQVREFWYRGLRAHDGVQSISDAGGSMTFTNAALLPSVRLVLDSYVRHEALIWSK